MSTKAAFITALGGATTAIGTVKTFTTTHAAETLTIAGHGKVTGDGPIRPVSTGQLPTGLHPQKATNGLTFTAGAIVNDVVRIGAVYYQFAADPTTGTPTGLVGAPYLVDVGASDEASLANLLAAINASGTPGTTYAAEVVQNAAVEAVTSDATSITLRARTAGTDGNALALVVTGDDGLAADEALFEGGTAAVDYYAIVVDENTLQLSLTEDGDAVTFSDDGSGTHTIGATAQGLADAIDSVLTNHLTAPGNRSNDPATNRTKLWEALVASII